jgi:hypothetical protein
MRTRLKKTARIIEVTFRLHNFVINWQDDRRRKDALERTGFKAPAVDDVEYADDDDIVVDDDVINNPDARHKLPYNQAGDNPYEEEDELASEYDDIVPTNDKRQSIVQLIQQNQWQRPTRNVERNG